jgi:hypothetical protein
MKIIVAPIAAILIIAAVFTTPANVSLSNAQTDNIQQQRMFAFDGLDKQHEVPLKFVKYENNTARDVTDFEIRPENVIQLYTNNDLVVVGYPTHPNILKLTVSDKNGNDTKQIQQKSPNSNSYYSLQGFNPGTYFLDVAVKQPNNKEEAVYETALLILSETEQPDSVTTQTKVNTETETVNENANKNEVKIKTITKVFPTPPNRIDPKSLPNLGQQPAPPAGGLPKPSAPPAGPVPPITSIPNPTVPPGTIPLPRGSQFILNFDSTWSVRLPNGVTSGPFPAGAFTALPGGGIGVVPPGQGLVAPLPADLAVPTFPSIDPRTGGFPTPQAGKGALDDDIIQPLIPKKRPEWTGPIPLYRFNPLFDLTFEVPAGKKTATLNYELPRAHEAGDPNTPVPVTCTPPPGSERPVGTYNVKCIAKSKTGVIITDNINIKVVERGREIAQSGQATDTPVLQKPPDPDQDDEDDRDGNGNDDNGNGNDDNGNGNNGEGDGDDCEGDGDGDDNGDDCEGDGDGDDNGDGNDGEGDGDGDGGGDFGGGDFGGGDFGGGDFGGGGGEFAQ